MQPILIDLDGTADFLFAVRIRGVICEAVNPLRSDMAVFDQRVRRADHAGEDELRLAVGDLARRLVDAMLRGCYEWDGLKASKEYAAEPLGRYESIVLLCAFLTCAAKAHGEDPTPFVDGSFSLIAEDDGVLKRRAKLAASLPPGRVVGARATGASAPTAPAAPANTEPQQGAPAASP